MASKALEIKSGFQLPALDGLRGVAVLLVVTYHFGLLRFGWMGVGLFFALSGYLITRLLLETKPLSLPKYLGRFYWRRTLRIWPLYFGFVLAVMAVYWLTGKPSGAGIQFPYLATFTYNFYMGTEQQAGLQQIFHVLWSISTEEQYYLVWPIIVWLLPRRGIWVLAAAMLVAAPIIRAMEPTWVRALGMEVATDGKLIYYFPFGQVDAFAIGALIAALPQAPWVRRPLVWGIGLCIPAALVVLRQFYLALGPNRIPVPIHLGFPVNTTAEGFHIWGFSAGYFCFGGLLILALHAASRNLWRRFLEWQPLRFMGRISFGMYVFHWPMLLILEQYWPLSENLPLRILQFVLFTALLCGIAAASFFGYESWFLRQKERLFN